MLTIKQERFVLEYMKDGNASRAYRESYNAENMKESSINVQVSKMLKEPKIAQRIEELRNKELDTAILNIEERKKILSDIARNVAYDKEGNASFTDARGAIDLLNKMDGVYIVKQQTELTGSVAVQKIERVIIDSSDSNA